ncbi:MAG: archaellin/type IV pilin N-terminal domain-containing protein [Candidatus Bathyarchaeia archaeon]
MKLLKSKKALSPVVASIILIAVTVAVSIAVAAWMGALTVGFMGSGERLKLGTPYGWTDKSVNVLATNEGGSTVKITAYRIQGHGVDEYNDIPTDIEIPSKETRQIIANITGTGTFSVGYEYTIVLVTTNNNEFRTSGQRP